MTRVIIKINKELKDLAYAELEALAEISNCPIDLIDDVEDLEVEVECNVESLIDALCRAALVKAVYKRANGRIEKLVEYPRSRYVVVKKGVGRHGLGIGLRIARLLVNLARVREGDFFLDPFVGSGTIAYEAAMLGARVVGIDLNRDYLKHAHSDYVDVINADSSIQPIREGSIDAIATDPPYNRMSITDVDLLELYRKFAYEAYKALKKGRYVAFSHPTYVNAVDAFLELGFRYIACGRQYVHGGLTRLICVFKRV